MWPFDLLIVPADCRIQDIDGNKENIAPIGPKYHWKKAKHREARAHIEAHRQVESTTKDMYLASAATNNGKHKYDSESEM